jgi:hypothetical protein
VTAYSCSANTTRRKLERLFARSAESSAAILRMPRRAARILASSGIFAMMSVLLSLLLTLRGSARSHAALRLEVLALRHQHDQIQGTICVIAYFGFVAVNSLARCTVL